MTAPATILLVEDNPITSKLVRFTLEREHYHVVDAPDARAACDAFAAHQPALVLLDLLLPDADGFEVFRRLRALPRGPDVPILAFTGLLSAKDEARIAEHGFDDIVGKPVEPARLIQIVKGYITPSDPPAAVTAGGSRTLVIADDDPVQRKLVALRLQRAGYRVVAVPDGQAALEEARAHRPFAIVSDVLMPRLDGFGLCMAVRKDPAIGATPIVLISNSYLDNDDKALAQRAGADELLLRTSELRDVIALLDGDLAQRRAVAPPPVATDPTIDRDRLARMMEQLDRQIARQSNLAQRCSLLSAELAVLSGISEAVATEHDLESTLHQILASCFDAGGISLGALYLAEGDELRGVCLGAEVWSEPDLASFFGSPGVLCAAIRTQTVVTIPSESHPEDVHRSLLERTGARTLVIEPLGYRGSPLGALVTMSRSLEQLPADRIAFGHALAGQISLALALARTFQAKDASERTARSNASVLRSILDSMAEGVLVGDETGAITHWNDAAAAILQLSPSEGRVALDADTHGTIANALARAQADRAELRLPDQSGGDDRWLSINARPLDDEAGAARGAVAVFRDVTTERQNNARMLVNERMASLGTLAAGVGHEINNPLMAVLGNLDMALADLRDLKARGAIGLDEVEDVIADAYEGASRVRNIVRDLKLFSRADTDARGAVDVRVVLESSLRMVANEIRHRARLTLDFQDVPAVDANESRLSQVFVNLIVNAAHAIPEGRASDNEIRVGTSLASDGRVRVEVTDTGCGMTPEIVAQIFTPFFTTKPIGVGTGLGLAICHQLVSAVGGEIVVDTAPGKGTTFAVMLPVLTVRPAIAEATVSSRIPRPSSRRARILVVDDEPMVGKLIARGLAHAHDVVAMTDPHAALRAIETGNAFDVVLCDLMMPDLSGMELHEHLARIAPQLAARTIFISGGAFTPEARAFLERTHNPTIDKPIEMPTLEELVAASLSDEKEQPCPSES